MPLFCLPGCSSIVLLSPPLFQSPPLTPETATQPHQPPISRTWGRRSERTLLLYAFGFAFGFTVCPYSDCSSNVGRVLRSVRCVPGKSEQSLGGWSSVAPLLKTLDV